MLKKAIIPVAGRATRLLPLTSAVPKALLPLVDAAGRVRCVLHWILAEAAAAGIDQAAVIVSPGQQEALERYFAAAREAGWDDLPDEIAYVLQPRPEGFGDAVARAADFLAGEERFVLLLGDHVYAAADGERGCVAQVAEAFEARGGSAMVGMQVVGPAELPLVGTARGEPVEGRVYRCTELMEKPEATVARERLATPGLGEDEFLAHCGIYAFTPEIFECLAALEAEGTRGGGEVELTDAQRLLLERHPQDYYLLRIAGRAYDTGTPAGYAATFLRLSA
jgi:UTP--glucose-1-phosphate uridylyltransferase